MRATCRQGEHRVKSQRSPRSWCADATGIDADLHACATNAAGTVRCWGLNHDGELGDGTRYASGVPVTAVGVSGAAHVAAGFLHTCAIVTGGAVECWGREDHGTLGNGP